MSPDDKQPRRSVLLSFQFLGTSLIGSLVMALVCALTPFSAQLAVLGAFISILGGLFVSYLSQEDERERRRNQVIERLAIPLTLASDHELYRQYLAICRGLTKLAGQADFILHDLALLKLASVAGQIESLAAGTVIFAGTETWRTVYEKILRSPDIKQYHSIAWVRSKEYWHDLPGRQSMQVNFEAAHRGLHIERIAILPEGLWPRERPLPAESILPWLREQHDHGIWLKLIRESDLDTETDLLVDFGIYGDRAVGTQELDERGRTLRFTLEFDAQAVRLAKDRWERLALYSTSFRSLLEQPSAGV
jgi:hypothetical protein